MRHISRSIEPKSLNSQPSSNTAAQQQATERLKPFRFQKGDPRINRNGRPRTFDQARALALEVLHKELQLKDGSKVSVAEAILTGWAKTKEHQKNLLELAFGKVPDKIEATGLEGKTTLVLRFDHERPELAGRN